MDENTIDKLKSILSNENFSDKLQNVLNNINSENTHSDSNSSISPENINNLISALKKSSESSSDANQNSNSSTENNIDFDTILKFKSMMDKINSKDDPRSKLLISLKPYLRESRKNKIDQYIQFLNMSNIFNMFSSGDNKK